MEIPHYQNINAQVQKSAKKIHGNNTVVQGHFLILYRGEQIQMLQNVNLQEILDLLFFLPENKSSLQMIKKIHTLCYRSKNRYID